MTEKTKEFQIGDVVCHKASSEKLVIVAIDGDKYKVSSSVFLTNCPAISGSRIAEVYKAELCNIDPSASDSDKSLIDCLTWMAQELSKSVTSDKFAQVLAEAKAKFNRDTI